MISSQSHTGEPVCERNGPTILLAHHRAHLRTSALTNDTIDRYGFDSLVDPQEIARVLNWRRPATSLGPCLRMPFFHRNGTCNGYCVLRPDKPRTDARGKTIKYEMPVGISPVAGFPRGTIDAANTAGAPIGLTEGLKKAVAADQAGCACICLSGVWAWQRKRRKNNEGCGKGERLLIPDLAEIDWQSRSVWLCFDADAERKPGVNQARAELARVLTEHGARVVFVDLPHGPREADGRRGKMGVDDFILAHGSDAFRELVERALAVDPRPRGLADWRGEMQRSRVASIGFPGTYVDCSPAGAGKSFADVEAARRAGTSLTVLPTHANCREVAETFCGGGLLAEAYPELCNKTCENFSLSSDAIAAGLAASAAVCPGCVFRDQCDYQTALADADAAAHRIATHQRAVFALPSLAEGRRYIAVHEDALAVIRPTVESASTLGFSLVTQAADAAGHRAADRLNDTQQHFLWRLGEIAKTIGERLSDATDTMPIDLPAPVDPPHGVDAAIFRAMQTEGIRPPGEAMRIARAAAAGELAELVVRVDRIFQPGGKVSAKRAVVAVWRRSLPSNAAVWLSDATASLDEIEAVVGPVTDATPGGRLETIHPTIQVPVDVQKGSAASRVAAVVRGLLEAWPEYQRIGVIIDRRHVPIVEGTARRGESLAAEYRERIVKVEHFRSGQSRGSNEWLAACDAIFIVGTPRVPPAAVRSRLIQIGSHQAASRDGGWGRDYWSGVDLKGRRHTIRTLAYGDHDWHKAYLAIVRAELIQAVGRGRGILSEGVPVVVASTEELGLPLAAVAVVPLTEAEAQVLHAIRELTAHDPKGADGQELTAHDSKRYLLESRAVSTVDVAKRLNCQPRWIRGILTKLSDRGLVGRIGQRGGWKAARDAEGIA